MRFPGRPDPFARMVLSPWSDPDHRATRDEHHCPPSGRTIATTIAPTMAATMPRATLRATPVEGKKGPGSRRGKYGQWERQGNDDQKRMLHAFSVPASGVQTSVTRRRQLPFKASVERFTEYVAITLSALSLELSLFSR